MRALVHSGGGSKGSYGAGAINYLVGDLKIQYDIISGISVGGINGAFLAQFPHGQEKIAASELNTMWLKLNNSKIYKRWSPFGSWHALWRSSLYDSSPLYNLIKQTISLDKIRTSNRNICIGTVSLNSGKYTIFNQTSDHFIDAVIAGASFPGMLEPIEFLGQLWSDGGIKTLSPISTAIDAGATTIDLIMTSPEKRIPLWIKHPGTLDILKRSIDLACDKIMSNDIEKVLMYNKLAQAGFADKKFVNINIIRPDYNLIEDVLDFNTDKIKEMLNRGYNDAKNKYPTNIVA